MSMRIEDIAGVTCVVDGDDGEPISEPRALLEEALGEGARVICVSAGRLDPSFFQLRSGIAGEMIQKVLNYNIAFAVVGDISAHIAASAALRDFVRECDRGGDIIFAPDIEALAARLAARAEAAP